MPEHYLAQFVGGAKHHQRYTDRQGAPAYAHFGTAAEVPERSAENEHEYYHADVLSLHGKTEDSHKRGHPQLCGKGEQRRVAEGRIEYLAGLV